MSKNLLLHLLTSFLLALSLISCTKKQPQAETLTVFTYASFRGHYGPGPRLVDLFEKNCHCKVNLVTAGEAGLILQRMKNNSEENVDVVIGLDQITKKIAMDNFKWVNLTSEMKDVVWKEDLPKQSDFVFIPYDWSPMTFVYNKIRLKKLTSWKSLLGPKMRKKISLQDPRLSTPGLQFLYWRLFLEGEEKGKAYLKKLRASKLRMSPSWSSAYGLFKSRKTDVVFSYLTSVVYHWDKEKNMNFQAAVFPEGHPYQIEYAAIPKKSKNIRLAKKFMKFLVSNPAQTIIMNSNYMLPSIAGVVEGTLFERLPKLKIISNYEEILSSRTKSEVLKIWLEIFKK